MAEPDAGILPEVGIWWAGQVEDEVDLFVLSSSHPIGAPSRPQIIEQTLEVLLASIPLSYIENSYVVFHV